MLGYGNFRGSGGGSGSGNRGGGFRGGGGFRRSSGGFNRGPREMTKIKCAECGKEDEVPFKPRDGSSVLCKDCYFKKKGITPRSNEQFGSEKPKESGEASGESDDFGEEAKEPAEPKEESAEPKEEEM